MKKLFAIILAVSLLLCGCGAVPETVPTDGTAPTEQRNHQSLTAENGAFDREKDLRMDVPQIGLTNVFVRDCSPHIWLDGDVWGEVYLLADDRMGYYKADHYLLVTTKDSFAAVDLWEENTAGNLGGEITTADVDGDGDEEILVQETVDAFGGAGQYRSWVFDYKDGEIKEMFCSVKNGELVDTGFSVKLLEKKQFEIQNSITGYQEIFTLTEREDRYFESWYDENGTIRDYPLWVDSFYEFNPVDTDSDGVWELECVQYTCLTAHPDCIGWAHTVLQYNTEKQTFEITNAWFETP